MPNLPPEIIDEIMRKAGLIEKIKFSMTSRFFKEITDKEILAHIQPYKIEELKLLSNKANFFDVSTNYKLERQDSDLFKKPKESTHDWIQRLENADKSCYALSTTESSIDTPSQLKEMKIYKSKKDAEKSSMNMASAGKTFYVKVDLPVTILKMRLSQDDFKNITPFISKINDQEVCFDQETNKFKDVENKKDSASNKL